MAVTVARLLDVRTSTLADEDTDIPEDVIVLTLSTGEVVRNEDRVFTVLRHWSVLENLGLECILIDNNRVVCYEILAYLIAHEKTLTEYFRSAAFPVELLNWYMAWDNNIENVNGHLDLSRPFQAMLDKAYSDEYVTVYTSLTIPMSAPDAFYVSSTLLKAMDAPNALDIAQEHYVVTTILLRASASASLDNTNQIRTWLRKVWFLHEQGVDANHQRRWMVEVFKFCMLQYHGQYRFKLDTIIYQQEQFLKNVRQFLTTNAKWKDEYPFANLQWFESVLPVKTTREYWLENIEEQNESLSVFYDSRPFWLMNTHDDFVVEAWVDPEPETKRQGWFISKQYATAATQINDILGSLQEQSHALIPDFPMLNAKQKAVIQDCIQKPVSFITGGPGCGKTFTFVHLLDYLRDAPVLACAFTGKATENIVMHLQNNEIERSETMSIMTIHRAVCMKMFKPLELTAKILIIDEASMVSLLSLAGLLRKFRYTLEKVVFVGDPCQLPPIDIGTPFLHMIHARREELNFLDMQMRSSHDITLNTYSMRNVIAYHLELGPRPPTDYRFQLYEGEFSMAACPKPDIITEDAWRFISGHVSGGVHVSQVQILCWQNATCETINAYVQERRLDQGQILSEAPPLMGVPLNFNGRWMFYINDRIVCTKNDYNVHLMNGSRGTVTAYMRKAEFQSTQKEHPLYEEMRKRISASNDDCVVALAMDVGETIFVSGSYLKCRFKLAYACTIHKAQGSEWQHVALYMPYISDHVSNSLVYTAITRARQSITIKAPTFVDGDARRIMHTGLSKRPQKHWCLFASLFS